MLVLAACLLSLRAFAIDVGLAGVTAARAMLVIDGGEPQAVAVGQSVAGVRVVSLQGETVVVEVDGRRRPLRVGQHAVGGSPAAAGLRLSADSLGHFYADGTVNGAALRFMVDTGATMVSLGAADARRAGIDTAGGQPVIINTANGQVRGFRVKLDTLSVGGITLRNIDALVHPADLPVALLGMSFLNRMEMRRDGDSMTLTKRF